MKRESNPPALNLYYDRTFDREAVKILPGEYFITSKDMVIVTVLGSCVAACIRDRATGLGGMNHFMLPHGADAGTPAAASMRYGAYAMEVLVSKLLQAGARRENLEAKVFGGGNVLSGITALNVGERNARFVIDYLKRENIRILAEDLNESYPRKVYFFPRSGKVLIRKLSRMNNDTLAVREREYADRLQAGLARGMFDPG
ncbi:MAG: chemoreceptor glutamine deamidase CheD [Noviherbaspirillum sp.]